MLVATTCALEILPRALADAVARIDRRLAAAFLGAEIGAPGLAARAVALRQRLAVLVGPRDAAEVGALAGPRAGDEERHLRRLRQRRRRRRRGLLLGLRAREHEQRRERRGEQECFRCVHESSLEIFCDVLIVDVERSDFLQSQGSRPPSTVRSSRSSSDRCTAI